MAPHVAGKPRAGSDMPFALAHATRAISLLACVRLPAPCVMVAPPSLLSSSQRTRARPMMPPVPPCSPMMQAWRRTTSSSTTSSRTCTRWATRSATRTARPRGPCSTTRRRTASGSSCPPTSGEERALHGHRACGDAPKICIVAAPAYLPACRLVPPILSIVRQRCPLSCPCSASGFYISNARNIIRGNTAIGACAPRSPIAGHRRWTCAWHCARRVVAGGAAAPLTPPHELHCPAPPTHYPAPLMLLRRRLVGLCVPGLPRGDGPVALVAHRAVVAQQPRL